MNVEELKQACSQYFSRYYSEFEDYLYVVAENKYKEDFPEFVLTFSNKKYDGIAFKFIDKNAYIDSKNVEIIDIGSNKHYKVEFIKSIDEFEAALSSYLKNYLYKISIMEYKKIKPFLLQKFVNKKYIDYMNKKIDNKNKNYGKEKL